MATRTERPRRRQLELGLPDRYRLLRHIATGGMASVWCAHDSVLGREVAIKLLAEQFTGDGQAVRRFKREARVAARLSAHPHIVTIFDVGQTNPTSQSRQGRPFIVMEHLHGGTVADALRVGAVDLDDALMWLHHAASALDYAHGRGVIHRDIKPQNFLLNGARALHVADFGIARIVTEETITSAGQLFGTAAYISPEQVLGHPAAEASDRYALAVAAFELLTGERPFTAEHFAAQARAHIEQRPPRASPLNPSLPRAIDGVLERGLAKRPEARWSSATEFVDALSAALRAPHTSRPIPSSTRLRGRAAALSGLAALAAALAVVLGALAGAGGQSTQTRARVAAKTHPTSAATPATASTPLPTADALEAQGHQLMLDGNYGAAIAVLRRAVAAASPASLTYAYALYDLGRSLRLAGDPQDAIPVLRHRLQIPNQTGIVQAELALALRAAGLMPPGREPGPGHGHGDHGGGPHGHGHGGGD